MLTSLYVRHFAVVETAEIRFDSGFTVVSGQTGAGKSLLVDALLLLTGARADSDVIRMGSNQAELMAEFDLTTLPTAREWLKNQALDENSVCQLRRIIRTEGSSRAWINGRPVTIGQLGDLGMRLVEIHGQNKHQALLSATHQLQLLDTYAGHNTLLNQIRELTASWRLLNQRIGHLSGPEAHTQQLERLRHECSELEKWVLPADRLNELEAVHRQLAHADELASSITHIIETLDGDSGFALHRILNRAQNELDKLVSLDERLVPLQKLLNDAAIQLGEARTWLNHYAQDIDLDPDRFSAIDEQLTRMHELGRRHRVPVAKLHPRLNQLRKELDQLEGIAQTLEQLEIQREQAQAKYMEAATSLSQSRRSAATSLSNDVSQLMEELGMTGGLFQISLEPRESDKPDNRGRERCQLQVSTNPGQPPRALGKVASGGELARISLAIEVATLGKESMSSMIFDEVDSGIGGAIAEVVGQKLRMLGTKRQVLCVTHLPQVAALGHAHLHVSKHSRDNTTHTHIQYLDAAQRRNELARMLGGVAMTRETLAHAEKMLEQAQTG